MGKIQLGSKTLFYPRPTLLVGANVDGKPNFMTLVAAAVTTGEPPMSFIAMRPNHYTYKGVRQNMTYSVNIPSADLLKETDFCGLVSGSRVNKAEVCQFKVFYGKLENAPLIEQCPINLECKVVHILDLGTHALIVGRIEETYISESCLTDGKPDVSKIKAVIYTKEPQPQYIAFGQLLAKAHSIGRELKTKEGISPQQGA